MSEETTFHINKKNNFSEWFTQIIKKAELADLRNEVKGFIVFRPWSVRCMKEMYRLYERELEKNGHWPAIFPALIPETLIKKEKEHVEGFAPEVFWVEKAGGKELSEKYFLRPTSETPISQMFSVWVRSWRDLPLKIYQSVPVWRCDTKATRPFIRSREFWWIEAHDVFATKQEAQAQVKEDMETTEKIMHQKFGVPFLFFRRPEWDKFPGAVNTYAADTLMPDGRIIQQPSTHLLGQHFSKPFNIQFEDQDGGKSHVWQTCYGPAISRIIASVIAFHGDDKGLIFPYNIAPLQVIIIPILGDKDHKVVEKCRELKEELIENGIRTEVDDSDSTPGDKYYFWEMKGVPLRIEIGPRELKKEELTVFRRDTNKRTKIKEKELLNKIEEMGKDQVKSLKERADKAFEGHIHQAENMEELKQKTDEGGFVKINICSRGKEGKECADYIKEETGGADVRGSRPFKQEKPTGNCIWCGKQAKAVVYVGKSY